MPRLTRIAPERPVLNLQEAVAFYDQKLGFRVAIEMPSGDYAIVERDEIAIHLFQDNAKMHSPVAIHLFTFDLDALCDEFHKRNVRLTQEIELKPWGNRDFRLKDQSGNVLKFTEPLTES